MINFVRSHSAISSKRVRMVFAFMFTLVMAAGPVWPVDVWARPFGVVITNPFSLDAKFGVRQVYTFKFTQAGCIMARIQDWRSKTTSGIPSQSLSLILNGDYRSNFYARVDNKNSRIEPLQLAYEVSANDFQQVKEWKISVVNFSKSGSATGKLVINLMPGKRPCPLLQPTK